MHKLWNVKCLFYFCGHWILEIRTMIVISDQDPKPLAGIGCALFWNSDIKPSSRYETLNYWIWSSKSISISEQRIKMKKCSGLLWRILTADWKLLKTSHKNSTTQTLFQVARPFSPSQGYWQPLNIACDPSVCRQAWRTATEESRARRPQQHGGIPSASRRLRDAQVRHRQETRQYMCTMTSIIHTDTCSTCTLTVRCR